MLNKVREVPPTVLGLFQALRGGCQENPCQNCFQKTLPPALENPRKKRVSAEILSLIFDALHPMMFTRMKIKFAKSLKIVVFSERL